jgi:hypothetical protein
MKESEVAEIRRRSRSRVRATAWLAPVFVAAAFVPSALADKPPKDPGHSGNSGQSENQTSGGTTGGSANSGNSSNPGNSGNGNPEKADSGNHGKPPDTGNHGKPPDKADTHTKSNSPANSAARKSSTKHLPAPDATLKSKSKAYGRYCQNQSKRHVAGQMGIAFNRCLTAMAKLATGVTKYAWTACGRLSRKSVPGRTGSPFTRCVVAGQRLLESLHKS